VSLLIPGGEEVLCNIEERAALDVDTQFFLQFASDRCGGIFSHFHSTAWQSPELVTFKSVQKHIALVNHHHSRAKVEAAIVMREGNHETSIYRDTLRLPNIATFSLTWSYKTSAKPLSIRLSSVLEEI
jgi:hypothetical protein